MIRTVLIVIALTAIIPALPGQVGPVGGVPPDSQRVPVPGSGSDSPPGFTSTPRLPADSVDPRLRSHLEQWEKMLQGTTNFYAECTRIRKHLILNKTTEFTGSMICLKPNLARMRIQRKDKPEEYVAYICNGQAVYEYDGGLKVLTEYKLHHGGVGDNLLLSFMSGTMTANDILNRFDLKILKEDSHYLYLEIRPRTPRDKQEFETMTLVLFQPSVPGLAYLPRAVVMRMSNGQEEERWDFPRPAVNVQGVKVQDFQPVQPPKDWKIQQAQQTPPPPPEPRVARPTTPGNSPR